jgi:hypothetical protein
MIGLPLKYSRLHMAMKPSSKVNMTFWMGYNKVWCIKLNGISETSAKINRLRQYFFLFLVFKNPSTSRNANKGKANRPNLNISCNNDMGFPMTVSQTALAQSSLKKQCLAK